MVMAAACKASTLVALLLAAVHADFILPAGNFTHSTNLFANYHFVPGYNAAGEWDLLTGGNWTPTNHSDAHLVGDAEIYLCPCPEPPCDPDPEPTKPGYSTSVFACLDQQTLNVTHAACTVFHATRTNVTCVTPSHAVSCDIPGFDSNNSLLQWWQNEEAPSRSFYSPNVTAVSCIVRDLGARPMPPQLLNMSDATVLQQALTVERCEVQCRRVCRTVCTTDHLSVHHLFAELNDWVYDDTIDNNPREFIANGTLFQERAPAQYLRGASGSTLGQEIVPLNITCTMPTLNAERHELVMGAPPANLTNQQGIFDMFGRRLNAMNVFDLAMYVALHALTPLENARCVTPFPNASYLEPLPGESEPYFHALVCHEPILPPYNISIGPAPASRRRLDVPDGVASAPWEAPAFRRRGLTRDDDDDDTSASADASGDDDQSADKEDGGLAGGDAEGSDGADGGDDDALLPGWEAWDDWDEWGEGNGSDWDWRHAAAVSTARSESEWARKYRNLRRSPPRRRRLHHEFDIARSAWDYWLDESTFEQQARLVRANAEQTGDCRFYHNCTDPLPPPLLLHIFQCWMPNMTAQPNVSTIPPRSLSARPRLHEVNINTTYVHHEVSCIRPSWPNATGISCLTPASGLYCPFTDTYRGNESELLASGGEYLNETTIRCTGWPLVDVYRHAADAGTLFTVPPNQTAYLDPWQRPCDRYSQLVVGQHHYCTIDDARLLRCTGHNADGRASLDWAVESEVVGYVSSGVEVTVGAKATLRAAANEVAERRLYDTPEEAAARTASAVAANPPGQFLDTCAGAFFTCGVEEMIDLASGNVTGTRVRCWGSNHSDAIDVGAMSSVMAIFPLRGGPRRVECGRRFVCALQPTEDTVATGPSVGMMGGDNWHVYCSGLAEDRNGFDQRLPTATWQTEVQPFTDFSAGGGEHACGTRNYALVCFGNFPPIPGAVTPRVVGMALGLGHTCVGNVDGSCVCFSGSLSHGQRDSTWLSEVVGSKTAYGMTGGGWPTILSISIGDSIACVLDYSGQAYCGGERAQAELSLIRPPVRLQPERTDIVERGVTFMSLSCGGQAARNGTLVQLGEQYCCGLTEWETVHCWGRPPPHGGFFSPREDLNPAGTRATPVPFGFFLPLNESNSSVYHVRNRRCVSKAKYLRDFGLRLLLDTHPAISFADATTNFTQLYTCFDAPRRFTPNASLNAMTWLGVNITNTSQMHQQRSWHLGMLLVLQLASYTDGLSCFNFSFPFSQLHCAPMIPYINRTVEVVYTPPKPFVLERISATDVFTTKFTLAHTTQPDNYCFEKLRLTPPDQFKRGGAWHRATQRVVDGFEAIFAFQITDAARLCKTVRALVTGTLLYERCMHTGSDGFAFVLRGGGPPTALGGGGGLLGYGGLNRTLAIEFDTWHNADMGDLYYNHISVQAGGPDGPVGAHKEHYLSSAIVDPHAYPSGLGDGKAHVVRVRYTPGFDADAMKEGGPAPSSQGLKFWVKEGPVGTAAFPNSQAMGTWQREGTGMLRVYLDDVEEPLMVVPIDMGYALGLTNGRAWTGFTAATGRRFQSHYVLSWQFCEGPSGCAAPMTACQAFGCNPLFPSARYTVPTNVNAAYADLQAGVQTPNRMRSVLNGSRADADDDDDSVSPAAPPTTPSGGAFYSGDGTTEVRFEPSDDEPPESTWGNEPAGWRLQLTRPQRESSVLDQFLSDAERRMLQDLAT